MKIKVCGMRDHQNIKALDEIREIDFIGHIFTKNSPRFIGGNQLKSHLPSFGVFVNSPKHEIENAASEYRLNYIQLHGDESPEFSKSINESVKPVVKVFAISDKQDFKKTRDYEDCCAYFLFDTKTKLRGGSGEKFNWNFINEYKGKTPFFLSGGISSGDVQAIKEIQHPLFFGIDINSRFETKPGLKNIEEINLFVKELKS
ncbi:MAG: N-(5'-phosphoribosyl)anthranilate isomerase [Fluviicola sp.]|nr:MAG: N-(5'-phosphoribosyl)anthranilate isomerase [Fluviicola sp.]